MSSRHAPPIYVRRLMPEVLGYPLWLPKPSDSLPQDYIRDGIQIGDLGYLGPKGDFIYLFNVGKAVDDPVNVDRTPHNFVPLPGIHDPKKQTLYIHLLGNDHHIEATSSEKKSIGGGISAGASPIGSVALSAGLAFNFDTSSTEAAYLVLPDGGSTCDYNSPEDLENYASKHAHDWYRHFNGQGKKINNGRLYLVTGWEKCRSWANACYSHTAESRAASLKLVTDVPGASIGGSLHYNWEVDPGSNFVHRQSYPGHALRVPAPFENRTENQTILLRGYCISVREKKWDGWVDKMRLWMKGPSSEVVKTKGKQVEMHEQPPEDNSIPYSRTTSATTETGAARTSGITQGHGAGTDSGMTRPNDSEIEGSYDEDSDTRLPECSEDESETDTLTMDIPYGHTTMQAGTLVQQLPGQVKIVHPLALINKHILDTHPDATIALTHDGFEWTGIKNDVQSPRNAMELAKYAIDNNLVSIIESKSTPNAWVAKRQKAIFALVIGIDKYQCKEYKDLQGACSDADKFEACLVEALGTPKANIISLRDGQATRSAIIDELIKMKDSTAVQQDTAAFIIYFAGYGAATTDPVGRTDGNTSSEKMGMVCPADIGILDKNDSVVNGIPARTINQLLLGLSLVKGDNIALILDCSYAAIPSDAQKSADVPAGAEPRQIFDPPELSPNCDQEIYSSILAKHVVPEFGSLHLSSHVLLTACSPLQFAYESRGEGLFTFALLKVMKGWPIRELTYKSLIHRLDMPGYQTPLLVGSHVDRCLFDPQGRTADSSRILCHHEKDKPYFTLYAGSDHGIVAGSVFEIYRTDLPDKQSPITTATAETVEASVSFLKPVDQTIFTIHKNRRVWYARSMDNPVLGFTIYCNDSIILAQILNKGVGWALADPPSSVSNPPMADLCLTVDGSEVYYNLGDRTAGSLFGRSMDFSLRCSHTSKVDALADIQNIIGCYAHFTSQIKMPSPLPMAKFASIEMNELRPSGSYNDDFEPVFLPGENLLPDTADKFVELGPFPEFEGRPYGFTIHNTSDDPLYVSLLIFDASSLRILEISFPAKFDPSPLEPHSTRTFCDGSEGGPPRCFFLPDGLDEDVTFFKFFVTEEPIDLSMLSQESPFAIRGEGHIKREAWHPPTSGKRWASMIIPVIQRRDLGRETP